jgi:hypothetical protein
MRLAFLDIGTNQIFSQDLDARRCADLSDRQCVGLFRGKLRVIKLLSCRFCAVLAVLEPGQRHDNEPGSIETIERVIVARNQLMLTVADPSGTSDRGKAVTEKRIAWSAKRKDTATEVESHGAPTREHNEKLIQLVVRAHTWVHCPRDGMNDSIEQLAETNRLHPKVVRGNLRLAFLSPDITSAILDGRQPAGLSVARVPKLLPLSWPEHHQLLVDVRRERFNQ